MTFPTGQEIVNTLRDTWAWAYLHPWVAVPVSIAFIINNGIRVAYRDYVSRPRWARFILGATDPLCGNFWRVATWLSEKFSLPLKFPNASDDSIAVAKIQQIVADSDAKKKAEGTT